MRKQARGRPKKPRPGIPNLVWEFTDIFPSDPMMHSDLYRWSLREMIDELRYRGGGAIDWNLRTAASLGLQALADVEKALAAATPADRERIEEIIARFKVGMEAHFVVRFGASELYQHAAEGWVRPPAKRDLEAVVKASALERKRKALDAEFANPKSSAVTDNDWAKARAPDYGLEPDKVRARLREKFGPVRQRSADWREPQRDGPL